MSTRLRALTLRLALAGFILRAIVLASYALLVVTRALHLVWSLLPLSVFAFVLDAGASTTENFICPL